MDLKKWISHYGNHSFKNCPLFSERDKQLNSKSNNPDKFVLTKKVFPYWEDNLKGILFKMYTNNKVDFLIAD